MANYVAVSRIRHGVENEVVTWEPGERVKVGKVAGTKATVTQEMLDEWEENGTVVAEKYYDEDTQDVEE